MIDNQFNQSIAKVLGMDVDLIKSDIEVHRKSGIGKLYARTKPYWVKSRVELALSTGDYLIDIKSEFPDLWQIRHIRSTEGKLQPMAEGKFREDYPDDSLTGAPTIYVPLDFNNVQFYPRSDTNRTLFISYFWIPSHDTITEIPDAWQHVVQDYVLAMMWPEPDKRPTMLRYFELGLQDVAAMAKPITEDDIDIQQDPLAVVIYNDMKEER